MTTPVEDKLKAYDVAGFKQLATDVVEILTKYLDKIQREPESFKVLPWVEPNERIKIWRSDISAEGGADILELFEQVVRESNHLHHKKYLGHQVAVPLPLASLCDLIASFLNNVSAVYEMGPVALGIEQNLVAWMAEKIGYDANASGGVLTSGGSLGNLTALLAARQQMAETNAWDEGTNGPDSQKLCVLVSEQSHYCVQRSVKIMGWGNSGIEAVKANDKFQMDVGSLKQSYEKAIAANKKIIAVVANACSTATGSYDPIDEIADFCEQKKLWLHVDGAHGASALLSGKYKSLLKGVNRADSVVWDAHKMMMIPSLLTGVIFKDAKYSHETFSQKADYIVGKDSYEEWYNIGHRTVECTKNMMGLKLYIALALYGENYFAEYLESRYDLARAFAKELNDANDFETPVKNPESNIVCFRYLKAGLNDEQLSELHLNLHRLLVAEGDYYLVKTIIQGKAYLRVSLMNPFTALDDLKALLDKIRELSA